MDPCFMGLALEQARKAAELDEVPVGCVIVHSGKVIGRGHNDTNRTYNGTRHAEFLAIDEVLRTYPQAIFAESDLYVTVEPCIMCASALRQISIRRVFFGAANERFGGCGSVLRVSQDPGPYPPYLAFPDIMRREAVILLREFYASENPKAPQPKQKKQRIVKEELPPLNITDYVSREDYCRIFGENKLSEYDAHFSEFLAP